ncbi:putative cell wall biogenesis protein Mhp1 [Aspergillus brunneoviolaceus CBS 621.78]|uniref:Cell wall biogenesis protein Mhp1 n=1 Tax=Aspergillus brunneoviolaceus CBS 621.78 TaxID=1450534 RepID=A0ACD1FSQ1_9EURO|nr:cell wall biogenesis protein Mhp1 [Aspergillus brunneoviolaceus CBS 621.78]RAH39992.1 cell wall biogenesis protein Mhp1 [Aspergillus brunneoviolaceus CBS 621.78]
MEGVETVDVSWLHHSQKDHLSRCKSASSLVSDKSIPDGGGGATPPPQQCDAEKKPPQENHAPSPPPVCTAPAPTTASVASQNEKEVNKVNEKAVAVDAKPTGASPASQQQQQQQQKSAPRPVGGRRNSWISSLSSRFSSGSTPPSQSNMKAPPSTKATSPVSKMDAHNPFGAAYSPKDKEEERKDENSPFASTSPKGPSFLSNAFRKLSSSAGGSGKLATNGTICPRRVMNIDQDRDRCKVADLNQAKLRRVAFCVDVEIAGLSYRESDEEAPAVNSKHQIVPDLNGPKVKRSNSKSKDKKDKNENTPAKSAQASVSVKEGNAPEQAVNGKPTGSTDTAAAESTPNGESKEPTRKQEKKKRSEEERRERRERRRRQAEANGTIPMQLTADGEEYGIRTPASSTSRPKTQSHPTTDPVRIYRRCCQLRETPVLKRIVDEISKPSSTLAESPGTVAVLDLSNFPMTSEDMATFCDWLAVVPVRKLILEECALTDDPVRSILAALLSTRTVEHMWGKRKRGNKSEVQSVEKEERFSVIEKLSLKGNPKIGTEGWLHICLFVHLSKSLKAIDLSGIPLPRVPIPITSSGKLAVQPGNCTTASTELTAVFANALSQRYGGDHLEELLLSECDPTIEDTQRICDAATTVGLRRLGFANNGLSRESLEHVVRYLKAGKCEGLDLGGNPIRDHLDLITSAVSEVHPLYALSLADCSLTPTAVYPLLQELACLPDLRFVDFSHNPDLFTVKPDALPTFRRFLPKMPALKRIHLADVNLSPDQTIALAEVLPECPSLCHLNILENPLITALASATDPATQEEACAVYASLMAAVRVSRTIIAVDIEVPTAENNEVVKALASQIVAYSLQNLEQGAMAVELSDSFDISATRSTVHVPEILQHIVGHGAGEEVVEEDDEPAPDEDYVIGGTGVVKALGVCLGNLDRSLPGDQSGPPSGTATPRHRKSRSFVTRKPRDMSKNLLESARNIRTRIQSALVREDRAGNDNNYRRLQFLDFTLQRMIQRFEDEYPETRIVPQAIPYSFPETSSQNSGEDGWGAPAGDGTPPNAANGDGEAAADDEDDHQYAVRLSRASSITSLHSRAMTHEEGHVHRLGQNLRRDFLSPSFDATDDDPSSLTFDESHIAALRDKLDRLHVEQMRSNFESVNAAKTFKDLGTTVDELWAAQKQDSETFEKFRQSQIAAQFNSGKKRPSSPLPGSFQRTNQAPEPDRSPPC